MYTYSMIGGPLPVRLPPESSFQVFPTRNAPACLCIQRLSRYTGTIHYLKSPWRAVSPSARSGAAHTDTRHSVIVYYGQRGGRERRTPSDEISDVSSPTNTHISWGRHRDAHDAWPAWEQAGAKAGQASRDGRWRVCGAPTRQGPRDSPEKEKKENRHAKRGMGRGQGPHLHEQDFQCM